VRYNLPKSHPKENAFSLNTSVTNMVPGICNEIYLNISMTYNLMDESSNMAVLEVELLSGYEPEKSTLNDLKQVRNLRRIYLFLICDGCIVFTTDDHYFVIEFKRWDFDEGKVNIYLDSIKKGALVHFGFVIKQKVIVEQVKPAQMKLYDYYEQESFVRQVRIPHH
jgi:A-macroglobulin receptor binding domain